MLDKETIVDILQRGLQEVFPTLDVSEGSEAYSSVIAPVVARLTTPDFTADPTEFLKDLIQQEHPDIATDAGGPFADLVLGPGSLMVRPVWQELQEIKQRMAVIDNVESLSAEEVDLALANLFEERREGKRTTAPVRVYYPSPTFDTWLPTDVVYIKGGLRFNPITEQTIESTEMATNIEGSEYYFDITVQAEEPGAEYNVDKEEITQFDTDAHPAASRVLNLSGGSKGLSRETNAEFAENAKNSLTERSLGTNRGIGARLRDLFKDQVTDYWTVGYNDPEQDRDIITGRDYGLPVVGGAYFSVGRFLLLISSWEDRGAEWATTIAEGDQIDMHFGPSYVYGQLPVEYRNQTNTIGHVLLAAPPTGSAGVGIYAFVLQDRPIVSSTALFDIPQFTCGGAIVKKQGVIRLSDIPGGIEFGESDELAIAPNQIHIGGHVDTWVNAADTETRTATYDGALSEGEIWSGEDLITEGAGSVRNRVQHATVGLSWVDVGVKATRHSLEIMEGDDKNQYRILAASDDYIILDTELLRSDTGLRYKIVGDTSFGLTDSSVQIYPTATSTATLTASAGAATATVGVNLKDYGVLTGDTIVIEEDDNAALADSYVIIEWDDAKGGKGPVVHKPFPASFPGVPFSVYRRSPGVDLPMIRVKSADLLDADGKKVGVEIPYSLPVDARNPRDFCGSFDICDDEYGIVLPDLQTFTLEDRECKPCLWPTNWPWPDPRDAETGEIPEPEWWSTAMGTWSLYEGGTEWPAAPQTPNPDNWENYCDGWAWPPEDFLPNGKLVVEFWDPRSKYPWLGNSLYTDPAAWGLLDVDYNDIVFDNVWSPYWEWAGDASVRFPYAYSGKVQECSGYIICLCTKFNEEVDEVIVERKVQYEICLPGSMFDGLNNVLMGLPNVPWQELSQWHKNVFAAPDGAGGLPTTPDDWEDLTPDGMWNPYTGEFESDYYPYQWMQPDEPNPAWDFPPVPPPCLCHASPGDIVTIGNGSNKGAYVIKKLHTVPLNFGLFAVDPDLTFLGGEWEAATTPDSWPANWPDPSDDSLPDVAPDWWTTAQPNGLGKTTEEWEELDTWPAELTEDEQTGWAAYWAAQPVPLTGASLPSWPPPFDPKGESATIPGEGSQWPPRHVWEANLTLWVCFAEIYCEFPSNPVGELIPWYCEKYLEPANAFGKYSLHEFLTSLSRTLAGLTGTENYEEPYQAYTVYNGSTFDIYTGGATNWPDIRTQWPSPTALPPVLSIDSSPTPLVAASGALGQFDEYGLILPHIVRTYTGKENTVDRRDLCIYTGKAPAGVFVGLGIGMSWVQTGEQFTSGYGNGSIVDPASLTVFSGADIIPNEASLPGSGDYFVVVAGFDAGPAAGAFVYSGSIDETGADLSTNFAATGVNLLLNKLPINETPYAVRIRRKPAEGTAFTGYYMLVLTQGPTYFHARIFETADSTLSTVMTEVADWRSAALVADPSVVTDFMVFNSGADVRAAFTLVDPASGSSVPETTIVWDSILSPAHTTMYDMEQILYTTTEPSDWGPLVGPPAGYVIWAGAGGMMNDPWGHAVPNALGSLLFTYLQHAHKCTPLPNTGRDRDGEDVSVMNTWDLIDFIAAMPGYVLETQETDVTVPMEAIGAMVNLVLEDTDITLPAITTDPGQVYNFLMETFFVNYKIGAPSRGSARVYFKEPTTVEFSSTCDLWSLFDTVIDDQHLTFAAIPDPEEYQLIPVRTQGVTPVEELPRTLIVADKISGVVQIQDESLPTLLESEIRVGEDILELYPEMYFNYMSGAFGIPGPGVYANNIMWHSYPVNDSVGGLIGKELSSRVTLPDINGYVFRPEDVDDFIFIEEGDSAAGYRIVDWISPTEVVLDRDLAHSTIPHEFAGFGEAFESTSGYISADEVWPPSYSWSGATEKFCLTSMRWAGTPIAMEAHFVFNADDIGKYVTIWGAPLEGLIDGTYRIEAVYRSSAAPIPAEATGAYYGVVLSRVVIGTLNIASDFAPGETPRCLFAVHAAPDEEMPATDAGGTELAGVMPFRMYRGNELEGTPLRYEISHIDPSLDPLGSYFTVRKQGSAGLDSYIPAGLKMPYRIVRPDIQRISSTEMSENREYGLYYADVEIFSKGSGAPYNLDNNTKLEPVFGTFNSDGYYLESLYPKKTFTIDEQTNIHLSNRVLPVGLADSPENFILLPGRSLSVDYDYSAVINHIQSVFSSSDERDICSDVLVHSFLPSYVYLHMHYYGGQDPDGIFETIRAHIAGRGATKELAVWELENLLRKMGATRVDRDTMLIALTHDLDRRIVGNRSEEKLGGDATYYFNGSNRTAYFQAGTNMSLINEEDRDPGERIVLEKAGSGSTSR
jgi:hypothetical protein